jgi:hypothetical protein
MDKALKVMDYYIIYVKNTALIYKSNYNGELQRCI